MFRFGVNGVKHQNGGRGLGKSTKRGLLIHHVGVPLEISNQGYRPRKINEKWVTDTPYGDEGGGGGPL